MFVKINDPKHFGSSSVELYNVKSGDLPSELNIEGAVVTCLAVCPSKRLFAIGLWDSNPCYKVIRVWLPGDRDSRKSQRYALSSYLRDNCQSIFSDNVNKVTLRPSVIILLADSCFRGCFMVSLPTTTTTTTTTFMAKTRISYRKC